MLPEEIIDQRDKEINHFMAAEIDQSSGNRLNRKKLVDLSLEIMIY